MRKIVFALLLFPCVQLFAVGCGTNSGTSSTTADDGSSMHATQTEVVLPSRTYREQAKSLEELISLSDACFTAELVRQEADYWPAEDPQISVFSRFLMRVRVVFHGNLQPGSELVLMIAGGDVASVGNPSPGGSFRPQPGQRTVALRFEDQPFPEPGRVEFVCASRFEDWAADIGVVYVPNPDGRFALKGDRLTPLVPPQESSPAVRSVLASATLDAVAAAFRASGASLGNTNP